MSNPKSTPRRRKRDRFLQWLRRLLHLASNEGPKPQPACKAFKRSALEKDLILLSTACLVDNQPRLRELMVAIVAIYTKRKGHMNLKDLSDLVGKCAKFTVYLARYIEQAPLDARDPIPVETFIGTIKIIDSLDPTDEAWLNTANKHIDESIEMIKKDHPSLIEFEKGPASHGLPGTVLSILDVGAPMLELLKEVLDMAGVVPFISPVLSAVTGLFHATQQTQSNFDEMLSLSMTAGEFALIIVERCSTSQELPVNLADAIEKLQRQLNTIASRCQEMSHKSFVSCFFQSTTFKGELDELRRSLENAILEFQTANLIDIQDALHRIADTLRQTANYVELVRLAALPKHPDMSGKLPEYFVESRTPNVEYILNWIANSNELLLCVHGTAGVGKTTLAGHLSNQLQAAGRLAGSIFLGSFPTDTSGPETIIKMLAYEIGSIHPRTRPEILKAMALCHRTSLETHLQMYILEPLKALNHPNPFVVVVDALDEWQDCPTFLSALAHLNSNASVIKIITTSRLNPVFSNPFSIDKVSVHTYDLSPVPSEAIKAYFEAHLKSVPWVEGRIRTPGEIDKLAELSGGLPAWASTVISLLSHKFNKSTPDEIFAEIVGSRRQVGDSDGLRELYGNALKRLFTQDTQQHILRCLWALVALQEPLPLSDFSTLSGIESHLIPHIQVSLSALQTRSPPSGPEKMVYPATALFHRSFLEYLQTVKTEDSAISGFASHYTISLACLEQLDGLPPPSPHHNFSRTPIQAYAIKYWPLHLLNGTPRSKDEWSRTEHCSMLQRISGITPLEKWAALFFNSWMPEEVGLDLKTEDGMKPIPRKPEDWLNESSGGQWAQVAWLEVVVRSDDSLAEAWFKLGRCYEERGHRMASIQVYEEALKVFRRALQVQPELQPNYAKLLDDAAWALLNIFWNQHEEKADPRTLDEAISFSEEALALCPEDHPARDSYLSSLAVALKELYNHNGNRQTLDRAISLNRDALKLRPQHHPNRFVSLGNLALSLQSLHALERLDGKIGALEEAVSLHRQTLELLPSPHPERWRSLNDLADALRSLPPSSDRDTDALEEVVSLRREALALEPKSHPLLSRSLDKLAVALADLYWHGGDETALNEALSLHHRALELCPPPNPERAILLNNLAFSLQARSQRNGPRSDVSALNECVSLHREVQALRPVPPTLYPTSLANLADALLLQFEQNKGEEVLNNAISLRRVLLGLSPQGHRCRVGDAERLLDLLNKRREVSPSDNRDYAEIERIRAELAPYN